LADGFQLNFISIINLTILREIQSRMVLLGMSIKLPSTVRPCLFGLLLLLLLLLGPKKQQPKQTAKFCKALVRSAATKYTARREAGRNLLPELRPASRMANDRVVLYPSYYLPQKCHRIYVLHSLPNQTRPRPCPCRSGRRRTCPRPTHAALVS
jgi:hypothetical protein